MSNSMIDASIAVEAIPEKKIPTLLEAGELGAMLDWKLTDNRTGKVLSEGSRKSESFVLGFVRLLWNKMVNATPSFPTWVQDTGGTGRNVIGSIADNYNYTAYGFHTAAGAGDASYGIQVGTGSSAPTITDYSLGAQIAHGVGVGQLQHSAHTYGLPSADSTTSQVTVTRNFSNSSGATVTVNEIGMACVVEDAAGSGTNRIVLVIKDVIGGGIAVPNGQTLTVNYRLQAVV